jgi:hypothetical protein
MTVKRALLQAVQAPAYQDLLQKRFFKQQLAYGAEADRKAARLEAGSAALYQKLGIAKKSPEELGLPKPGDFEKWWPPKDYKPSVVE